MIDPVETVVTYLRGTEIGDTVEDRLVAGRARFGSEWTIGQKAINLLPMGGPTELYVPLRNVRIASQSWGATEHDSYSTYLALMDQAARVNRQRVVLNDGQAALLHALLEVSAGTLLWDDEVGCWTTVAYLMAIVGEHPTT